MTRVLAAAPFFVVVTIAVIATTYGFPQTDDYCTLGRLYNVYDSNVFFHVWDTYFTWAGRYSAFLFVDAVGIVNNALPVPFQTVYAGALLAGLLLVLGGAFLATNAALGRSSAVLALIIAAGCVALMPSKLEGLMWLSGMAVYTIGVACLLALIGSVARDGKRVGWFSVLLIVLACGFNEFIGVAVGILIVLRALLFLRDKEMRTQSAVFLGVFLVAFLVSILAPGNFVRTAAVATAKLDVHNVLGSLLMAKESFDHVVFNYVQPNWPPFLALVVAAFLCGWGSRAASAQIIAPAVIALLAALPLHVFLFPFLMGEPVQGRALNEVVTLVLAGVILVAAWLGAVVSSLPRVSAPAPIVNVSILVSGLVLCVSPATQQFTNVIRDYGSQWREAQLEREMLLTRASGHVTVPALPKEDGWPPVFLGTDLQPDPKYWVNACTANFYGLDSIAALAPVSK